MALLNDIKRDYRIKLAENGVTSVEVTDKLGVLPQNGYYIINRGKTVSDGFIKMYEALGYDIRIEYVPREK